MRSERSTHDCLAALGAQPHCRSGSRQAGWLSTWRQRSFHELSSCLQRFAERQNSELFLLQSFSSPLIQKFQPLKDHSTLHPNVISLSLTSAYLCQTPPTVVLQHPALPFTSQPCLTGSQSPLLFAQSLQGPGCLLPCPTPQGHLHLHFSLEASSTPFPALSHASWGGTGVFLFSVVFLLLS